jgi:Acetyltransferase (GNAT) domain
MIPHLPENSSRVTDNVIPMATQTLNSDSAGEARLIEARLWRLVDPRRDPEWDRLVLSHADYSFFHSAAWARVLSATYGHEPRYFGYFERGEPVALVPMMGVRSPITGRRGVCLPFSDFCGPLLFREDASAPVIEQLSEMAREGRWKYFEIRGGRRMGKRDFDETSSRQVGSVEPLSRGATPAVAFYGHTLDLRCGPEALFGGLKSSVRRALRKATERKLAVQVSREREAILAFYRLHVRTRRQHGLPPQPVSFFLNIHQEIIEPGLGFVVIATSAGRPVATAVFFHFGTKAVYKFGASDERFQELRGNNLVMWEAIRFLAQSGKEQLHFGRTALENDGLRRFKLGWGAEEELIEYHKWSPVGRLAESRRLSGQAPSAGFSPRNADFSPYGRTMVRPEKRAKARATAIFSRLPLAINRLAGALLYPHLD